MGFGTLENGLRGTVIDIFVDLVKVKLKFATDDPVDKKKPKTKKKTGIMQKDSTVFSIIIDRSQRMTLDWVIVKCKNGSQLGQLLMGVARTTSIDGP